MSAYKDLSSHYLEISQDESFNLEEEEKQDIIPYILTKYPQINNSKDLALLVAFKELSQTVVSNALKNLKTNINEKFSEVKDDISRTEDVLFKAAYNNLQHIAYLERHLETAEMNDTQNGLAWDSRHP